MKVGKLVVAVLLAAVPVLGMAQQKAKKELNPWIDCGIGAMIFAETTWAAVSSNVIWDLGTTAVTSDQMSQHTCNSKKAQAALYIGVTYANLSEETVKGDGKHLHAMLDIMSCDAAAQGSIISDIRTDFGRHLREQADVAKSQNARAEEFYNIVQSTIAARYAQQCRT
jgi:hypothetical protein